MKKSLRDRIDELAAMDVKALQAEHVKLFGQPATSAHRQYLFRKIAWQVQAEAQGGLPEAVREEDRLTRSLLDFARIMEVLDKHGASFVSVTQQFNTTSSLGRLTLNILLSFAQFEREMIAERTRDKMSAARRKGRWVGGIPMLGYDLSDQGARLVVNEYLEYGSLMPVVMGLIATYVSLQNRALLAEVQQELAELENRIITRINGQYVRSGECRLRAEHLQGRLATLCEQLRAVADHRD